MMYYCYYYCALTLLLLPLNSKWTMVSSFHRSSLLQIHNIPLHFSHSNLFCLHGSVDIGNRNDHPPAAGRTYSISLVTNRERALDVMVFRFGVDSQSSIEEHMEENPEFTSPEDALRSLTRSFDDEGKQKVFYADGEGEAIQFFALADDISAFVSTDHRHDKEKANELFLRTHGVIGSIQATKEYFRENENVGKIVIELKNLGVHEISRRLGIGKALTEAVQQYACRQVTLAQQQQQNQMKEGIVYLLVQPDNEGAIQLYKETGFVFDRHNQNQMKWSTDGSTLERRIII
mmetsp:Transcript_29616/g.33219  ORF Transcript_29616/g.33219 Transcript_29616/m.33219 type:complete len:290 (-) Transcript_29616:125-994(-)